MLEKIKKCTESCSTGACIEEWRQGNRLVFAIMRRNKMQREFKSMIKAILIVAGSFLIGWISYWADFSKSLEISLHINQRNWSSQATEYDRFVTKLDSGKIEEVTAELKAMSAMLKEQASVPVGAPNSVSDLLVPTGGLALLRDYNADRAKSAQPQHAN